MRGDQGRMSCASASTAPAVHALLAASGATEMPTESERGCSGRRVHQGVRAGTQHRHAYVHVCTHGGGQRAPGGRGAVARMLHPRGTATRGPGRPAPSSLALGDRPRGPALCAVEQRRGDLPSDVGARAPMYTQWHVVDSRVHCAVACMRESSPSGLAQSLHWAGPSFVSEALQIPRAQSITSAITRTAHVEIQLQVPQNRNTKPTNPQHAASAASSIRQHMQRVTRCQASYAHCVALLTTVTVRSNT